MKLNMKAGSFWWLDSIYMCTSAIITIQLITKLGLQDPAGKVSR